MRIIFEINGKSYEVRKPTIRDYYKIQSELALNPTPGFFLLSLLSDCPEEEIRKLTTDDYESLWEEFLVFYQEENASNEFTRMFKIGKKEYGLINLEKLTIGEFADLDILLNDPNIEKKLHEVMSILYREIISTTGEKYVLAPYDLDAQKERAEVFLDLPVSYTKGTLGFFLLSALQSIKVTLDSLEKEEKLTNNYLVQEALRIIRKFQEPGSPLFYFLPEEVPLNSIEPLPSRSTPLLTFSPSKKTRQNDKNSPIKSLFKNISVN
jgi:hypothetical protein